MVNKCCLLQYYDFLVQRISKMHDYEGRCLLIAHDYYMFRYTSKGNKLHVLQNGLT